jgi:hypothetical protein
MVKTFFRSGNVEGKIEKDFLEMLLLTLLLCSCQSKGYCPRESDNKATLGREVPKLRIAEKIIE